MSAYIDQSFYGLPPGKGHQPWERQLRAVPGEELDNDPSTANTLAAAGLSASALKDDGLGITAASTMDVLGSTNRWGSRSLSEMAQFMEVWVVIKIRGV